MRNKIILIVGIAIALAIAGLAIAQSQQKKITQLEKELTRTLIKFKYVNKYTIE